MNSDDPDFPVDPEETDNDVHPDDDESLMDDLPLPEPVAAPVQPVVAPPAAPVPVAQLFVTKF